MNVEALNRPPVSLLGLMLCNPKSSTKFSQGGSNMTSRALDRIMGCFRVCYG